MNTEQTIQLFGSATDINNLPHDERKKFAALATIIHRAGYDWYSAESGKVCWGSKELGAPRAIRRMGRLTFERGYAGLAIALGKVSMPAFLEKHHVAMEELAGVGPRFVMPLSVAQELFEDEIFLQELRDHFRARNVVGHWPNDYLRGITRVVSTSNMEAASTPVDEVAPTASMVQRFAWLRKGHTRFAREVRRSWHGVCALHRLELPSGLLIASHIVPWAESDDHEKADPQNGILLSSPIDALFDRGHISFTGEGEMLVSTRVSENMHHAFGLFRDARIDSECMGPRTPEYLKRHRAAHGFKP